MSIELLMPIKSRAAPSIPGRTDDARVVPASLFRNTFLLLSALLLLGMLPNASVGQAASDALRAQNVLFILSDDHAAHVYRAYGNDIVRTPNLDRLAAEGMQFTRAYANSPVCTPSRQSVLTGKLPHAAGVTLLRTPLSQKQVTLADHLKKQGYATGAVGKMHFNSELTHGFDYRITGADYHNYLEENPPRKPPEGTAVRPPWRPFQDPARVWLNAEVRPGPRYEEASEGTYLTRRAISFMEENQDEPFFLQLGYHVPHSPFNFPIEYAGRYDPDNMPLPPTSPEDEQWMPDIFEGLTEEDKRGIIASYYTSVEYLDTNVGRVLDALGELGLADNTLVIYAGDHGYLLGHHGRFEKHMMWEEAVKAPLVMRSPGLDPGKEEALVGLVDLAPTILDVLNEPAMDSLQGKSLAPLLTGKTGEHREYVFSEFLADNKAMVRTKKWKYIFTSGKRDLAQGYATGNPPPGIDHRLYNVQDDPNEHTDLADNPHYSGVLRSLQLKMLRRFRETHPAADELLPQFSVEDALVWFTEPPERR